MIRNGCYYVPQMQTGITIIVLELKRYFMSLDFFKYVNDTLNI